MHSNWRKTLIRKAFKISTRDDFEQTALEIFAYQKENNKVYKRYIELLGKSSASISHIHDIPCLPVSIFKTHKVLSSSESGKIIFRSSGTSGSAASKHYVEPGIYEDCFLKCFEMFYGKPHNYCILALLPSYLERGDSSLIYMAKRLIGMTSGSDSGFYLDDMGMLAETLMRLEDAGEKIILLGVSFALLELAEKFDISLQNTIVMETGGMKGRRKELTREELHGILKSRFGVKVIHSEYGMTELLSQAYSKGEGKFLCPPWMKILIRDPYNPLSYLNGERNGGVNIIDLANIDSCAFLETGDLGRSYPDGHFEILGRFDHSDLRGCNLLVEQ
jgi:phenylacetate-coenzyme A ligase PaaK-like adenylate-forming protein